MPITEPTHSLEARATLRLYFSVIKRHKREALLSLLLPISGVILNVLMPFFASKVLADLITHSTLLWAYFWLFAACGAVGIVLNGIGIRSSMALQAKSMHDLHQMVFQHLLHRSVGFYNNQIGGKLISDVIDFISGFGMLINAGFISGFTFLTTTLIGLIIVLVSNWAIGLAIISLLTILVIWTIIESRKRSHIRNERLKISKALVSHLSDSIVNAVTVKTFAQEEAEFAKSKTISLKLAEARKNDWQRTVTSETQRMGLLLFMQVTLVLVLILIAKRDSHLLAAGIFAFTYTIGLISRFFNVNTIVRQVEDSFLQASSVTTLLKEDTEIVDTADAKPLNITHGEIQYKGVAFHYADAPSSQNVFTELNLHIKPGEKIGLVGHSGGGKSTFTRLLLRFDDISKGQILIDGQDIQGVTQSSLRQAISYVPQEPLLFHRTIKENIGYGKPDANQAEIEAAAHSAYAHEFITALPEGYDTIVGERGVKLSGGQRQRVAIARAMLKDAPILVLDEATSALDSESEKVIQEALWKLMEERTAIVIAHRLSTIQRLDRIVVLANGKIVEEGSHKELLNIANGTYAKLWAHQSGGFIED